MHFNDLIIRLRTQALAAVAALSTIVGIFAKADLGEFTYGWEIAGYVFLALTSFWIAIWILDFTYYNKLLIGAVAALIGLEEMSKTKTTAPSINLSTLVEQSVASSVHFNLSFQQKFKLVWGRWAFYVIVLIALLAGAYFALFVAHPTTTVAQPALSAINE
jgi:hypothetical protein